MLMGLRQRMPALLVMLITLFWISTGYAQTFSFTADAVSRHGDPGAVVYFPAVFESLIDDTQWVNFYVDAYDFPDQNWRIGICNDSGCFAPGFNDLDNLYQPFERDTLVSFDVYTTDVGDSGHFSATLTAARDPEHPQTIHFTVYIGESGVIIERRMAPEASGLITSYPNPFNSATTLQFSIDEQDRAELAIYDLFGREVARLLDGEWLPPGLHQLRWLAVNREGTPLPSGVYFAKLNLRSEFQSYRLYLVR